MNRCRCSLFVVAASISRTSPARFAPQISRVHSTLKSLRPAVKFSVSPFGLYRPGTSAGMPAPIAGFDPYSGIYADSLLWLRRGWVDFLAPQLYWAVNSTHQSYSALLDWWLQHNPLNRYQSVNQSINQKIFKVS